MLLVLQSEPSPEELRAACGDPGSWICRNVLDVTNSKGSAEFSDLLFGTIGRIFIVLGVAWLVSRVARRAIRRFADKVEFQDSSRSAARSQALAHVLESVSRAAIWAVAFVTILGELDINIGPLIASAGIAGVALGFGAQSLVKDFLSGFFILVEDQYGVGDIVDLGDATGTVEAVNLRTTRLRDVRGTVWHVPNGTIQRVANMSQQWARALLDVSVAYGTDVDRATEVIKETAEQMWRDPEWEGSILEQPEVWGVEQLSQDAIQIRLVVKTRPSEQFRVTRDLRRRLLPAFEAAGIAVPNGQRTVVLREDAPPT
ncbi:MAG TPA: mechanosensitive ion channel family protein [Acidimicrobiales bacterium]|jgi:small conductance mechanosensitive channel